MIDKTTFSQAYAVIVALGDEYISRLPEDVLALFKKQSNDAYMPKIDAEKPLREQGLSEEAMAMIAMLRLEYWCDTQEEKDELLNYLETNQQKLEEILGVTNSARELLRLIRKNKV
ncbi:MAG: hypothetical protein FWE47_01750 [Oscillospiraceae bacterium]|nr:hypothetical protein [Oscillospiraceae bacterium]